jgi:Predicted amidophosphoribosyltransferases
VCWEPCHASDLCDKCRTDTPAFAGLRSAYLFRDGVRELVHRLKYQHQASLASPMSSLLYEYMADNPLPADVLVPVPLFPRRRRIRGYNQSALLAQGLARRLGLPVDDRTLVRARNTASQAETANAEARKLNVSGAFQCKGGALRSKRVLLIDDVATTGATLNACAQALREAGAASVWALTFARED